MRRRFCSRLEGPIPRCHPLLAGLANSPVGKLPQCSPASIDGGKGSGGALAFGSWRPRTPPERLTSRWEASTRFCRRVLNLPYIRRSGEGDGVAREGGPSTALAARAQVRRQGGNGSRSAAAAGSRSRSQGSLRCLHTGTRRRFNRCVVSASAPRPRRGRGSSGQCNRND